MMKNEGFAALILTHGRADRVYTYETLRKHGYTGRIVIVIDNEDKEAGEYHKRFGDQVFVFDKMEAAKTTDDGDNFGDRRGVIFARNSCFEIAEKLGIKHFVELDDDYVDFRHKRNGRGEFIHKKDITDLDAVFDVMLDFFRSTQATSIAMAQGGDFIGGADGNWAKVRRKVMNSFICSVDRPWKFYGRSNEDLTTSVLLGSRGAMFLSFTEVALQQKQTQQNAGGMTELYLDQVTYVKSLYSVVFAPSSIKVSVLNSKHSRIHHRVSWKHAVPCIISESHRKGVNA